MTTKKRIWIGVTSLSAVAVAIAAYALSRSGKAEYPTDWYTFIPPADMSSVPKGNSVGFDSLATSVSYTGEAIVSDFPSLQLKAMKGQAKFLPYQSDRGKCSIGYVVNVECDRTPKDKIPERFKQTYKIGKLTVLPVTEGTYEIHFVLRLIDADGFEILKADTPRHNVQSGKAIRIQSQTEPVISADLAALTKKIEI